MLEASRKRTVCRGCYAIRLIILIIIIYGEYYTRLRNKTKNKPDRVINDSDEYQLYQYIWKAQYSKK